MMDRYLTTSVRISISYSNLRDQLPTHNPFSSPRERSFLSSHHRSEQQHRIRYITLQYGHAGDGNAGGRFAKQAPSSPTSAAPRQLTVRRADGIHVDMDHLKKGEVKYVCSLCSPSGPPPPPKTIIYVLLKPLRFAPSLGTSMYVDAPSPSTL